MAFKIVNYSQGDPVWQTVKIRVSSETIGYGYSEMPKPLNEESFS